MTNEPLVDPLFDALSALPSVTPRALHERRVRQRCHAVLADQRAARLVSPSPFRVGDMMIAGAVGLYVVMVVIDAVRLLATG